MRVKKKKDVLNFPEDIAYHVFYNPYKRMPRPTLQIWLIRTSEERAQKYAF